MPPLPGTTQTVLDGGLGITTPASSVAHIIGGAPDAVGRERYDHELDRLDPPRPKRICRFEQHESAAPERKSSNRLIVDRKVDRATTIRQEKFVDRLTERNLELGGRV